MEIRSRVAFWLLAAGAAVLLLLRSGTAPLTDPDEARFARVSVEMLRSGDLVVPTFEGAPRLVRPPLFHWTQAALFGGFGVNELTARLPSVLATLGSLLLVGFVARRRFGEEGAAWAAIFYATMPLVVLEGKVGTFEALFAVHVLGAVALDMAEPGEAGPYKSAALGALIGLAFLAKGPVGIVLPIVLILAGRTAAGRVVVPAPSTLLSAAGAWCVVVVPWGLAFLERVGAAGTLAALRREAFEPYFGTGGHTEPSWFYAKVTLAAFLPWLTPLALGLVRVLGRRRDPESRTALYAAAALVAGLLFFSLGGAKLSSFILPLAPLAAIVITWELGQELAEPAERRMGPRLLIVTLALVSVFLGWGESVLPQPEMRRVALAGATAYAGAVVVALVGMALRRVRWVYASAVAACLVLLYAASSWLFPVLARQRSAEPLLQEIPELHSFRPVVLVGLEAPSLTFYLDRALERIELGGVAERISRGDSPLLVLDDAGAGTLPPPLVAGLRELGRSGRYLVCESATSLSPIRDTSPQDGESVTNKEVVPFLTPHSVRGRLP